MNDPERSAQRFTEPGLGSRFCLAVEPTQATAAGICDALAGAAHNFAPDRRAAEALRQVTPHLVTDAARHRAFVHRAVRRLTGLGITQYLDLGCGLPLGAGSVHHTARVIEPCTRAVYVDHDPVVSVFLAERSWIDDGVGVLTTDLRQPDAVLKSAKVVDVLDLERPSGRRPTGLTPDRPRHASRTGRGSTAHRQPLTPYPNPGSSLAFPASGPGTPAPVPVVLPPAAGTGPIPRAASPAVRHRASDGAVPRPYVLELESVASCPTGLSR